MIKLRVYLSRPGRDASCNTVILDNSLFTE